MTMPSINEQLFDLITSHRIALLRYEGGTVRAMLTAYDAAFKAVLSELRSPGSMTQAEIERLQLRANALAGEIRRLNRELGLTLDARLAEAAAAEARFQATRIGGLVGPDWVGLPEDQVLVALSTPVGGYRAALAIDLMAAHDEVQSVIAQALARGLSMDRAATLLAASGIVDTYRNRVVAIARTEIQRVANETALRTYARNEDVIKGVQYLATLDSRTCPICAAKHNKVYPLVNGKPVGLERIPPLHPRCRCFLAPVTKSWRELGLKEPGGFDGEAATSTSFDKWLSRQKQAVQDDILGKTRATLWRAGTVPLTGFSDQGRLLNLGELRARYDI
jgi:SPP1 gp7 family putative phage head morphogenesis protein